MCPPVSYCFKIFNIYRFQSAIYTLICPTDASVVYCSSYGTLLESKLCGLWPWPLILWRQNWSSSYRCQRPPSHQLELRSFSFLSLGASGIAKGGMGACHPIVTGIFFKAYYFCYFCGVECSCILFSGIFSMCVSGFCGKAPRPPTGLPRPAPGPRWGISPDPLFCPLPPPP